jgi:16S rRNA processing protein RimM
VTSLRSRPTARSPSFAGVDDRDAAAALTLSECARRAPALPPLAPGEYYVSDVVGCAVVDENGAPSARVDEHRSGTARRTCMVVGWAGAAALPLVPSFVVTVDAPGRKSS